MTGGIKKNLTNIIVWTIIFVLICWSAGLPLNLTFLIPEARAAGGIDAQYTDDGGSANPPEVYLNASSTPESIIKITAYDTTAGANRLNGITLQVEAGWNCPMGGGGQCSESPFTTQDLGALTTATTSGVSLWLDDGDSNFELTQDTLISSTTETRAGDWTTQTITDPYGGTFTVYQTIFSNLNLTIPTSFSSPLTVFVVARASGNFDASPLHKFMPKIPYHGIDVTSASITDWPSESMGRMFGQITLGTEGGGDMQQSAPLAISEVQIASSTAAVEFIEIYNKTDQPIDLFQSLGANSNIGGDLNLHIVNCTGASCTGTTTNKTLTLTTNNDTGDDIPAYGYFLIASTDWNTALAAIYGAPDATYEATTNGLAPNGGVYISASSTVNALIIDKVGWGNQTQTIEGMAVVSPPANGSLERKAYPSSTPTSMLGVDGDNGNGSDTNNNSADFVTRNLPQPQNRLSATENYNISTVNRNVVLNEFLYNTTPTNGWIEFYNASSTAISINNWTINIGTSTITTFTLPNISMSSQSFVVVFWNQTGANDTDTSDGSGSVYTGTIAPMSTYGGDITLKNNLATIKDYMQYGGSGKAGEAAAAAAGEWTTGNAWSNTDWNVSLGRYSSTGDDYNNSSDWVGFVTTTRGLPNTGGDTTNPDPVSNVVLSDADSTGFGLDGGDVRISWTPSSTIDPSFDRYEVYLLPDGVTINSNIHTIYNTLYGQYMWEGGTASSSYAFTGGGFSMSFNSTGNVLSSGASYRAVVIARDNFGNRSAVISSAPATLTAEDAGAAGADTIPPMIDHMPIWRAPVGANLTFYARMGDDRTLATSTLEYKINNNAWGIATTSCASPAMAGDSGLRRCIISWNGAWDDTTTISYYLRAIDDSNNDTYLGMYPTDTESTAKANAVNIDLVTAASWNDADSNTDLSGTIYNSFGSPIQDAFIIIEGVATTTATTTSSGAFTFNDNSLPEGMQWIRVIKDGYMETSRDVYRGGSGLALYLTSGYMSNSAGGSGGGNGVSWTAPMDGMMMAPTNIACTGDCSTMAAGQMPIIVNFFNQMNASTIDDMDASNAGSNIYLTADGNTKISGIKVKYVSGSNETRIYSGTALSANTFYTVVLTPNVQDNNGNPIQSNRPSGNYEFSFNTMGDNTGMWGGGGMDFGSFGSGGMFMPPFVNGTNPAPGSFNIPLSAAITIEFSEAMDPSVTNAVKLYRITNVSSWTATEVTDKNVTATLDNSTKKIVTLTHTALDNNSANNGWYEARVMGSAKSQLGVWLGNPMSCTTSPDICLASQTTFSSSFQVGTAVDETLPTVAGTYPANNDGISNSNTVDVSVSSLSIGFSEAMNPSTINSQTITLKKGTVSAAGAITYNSLSNSAKFMSTNALTANTVYTLTITTGVTDLSGNALAANNIISFKTGTADTTAPEVFYANGDDYQIAITFSEPMNSAPQTDTTNWTTSVLNPANYYLNTLDPGATCSPAGSWACNHSLTAPYNTIGGNQVLGISGITLSYDANTQTVTLKGLDMCPGTEYAQCTVTTRYFQIFLDNVQDKSQNAITDTGNRAGSATHRNANRAEMQNSALTYGMLGPGGGPGMMMGGGGPGGTGMTGGPMMDMGQMGMFKAGAFPMNAIAGQTSNYMIDIPVTKALQDGMQIVLTFDSSFDVSALAKDTFSPVNSDMNMWNGGTVTFDTTFGVGGIASTTKNIITIKLDIATSSTNMLNTTAGPDGYIDSLHIDLKGIRNSSVPKDFGTSGYTVDIKTKSSDGALLENITTMPFFITEGGSDGLTVVINSGNVNQNNGTMTVYLGSFMTGPMEAESTTFTAGIATSTFSSLISGGYMLFTDPFITIGSNTYLGNPMPDFIQISGAASKNITLEQEGAGATKAVVNAVLQGNFSTGGVADDVDIFANSPSGFRVKTVNDVGNTTSATSTLYLTEGEWMIGVGPAMPKGPMSAPPTMRDWMEPTMIKVIVGVETINTVTLGTAANGNNNPVVLNVSKTNNFQAGDTVGFSSNAATSTITALVNDTSLTVVPTGNWGATLPAGSATVRTTRESSVSSNDGNIYFNIANQSLKNIIGFVVDGNGNAISGAEVYAYQPQGGFGGAHASAETNGKFTLKVGLTGDWTIGAFKPGMPGSQEKSVNVRDNTVNTEGNTTADIYLNGILIVDVGNDNSNANDGATFNPLRIKLKRPDYTISGKVLNSSSQAVPYAPVWAYQPSGTGHADTMTNSSGNYILYVDAGTWTIETDAPGVGWMQYESTVTITTASQSNINIRPDSDVTSYTVTGTVTIDGSAQTYMPIRAVKYNDAGIYGGREYNASTDANGSYSITAPSGYYRIDTWTPTYGEVELNYDQIANSPANINLNAATTTANITVASADLQTVSIQFTNGAASQTGYLHISEMDFGSGNPKPTGYNFFTSISGLSATSTVKLKGTTGGKYYFFDLDVPGYGHFMPDAASRALLSNAYDCIKLTNAARAVYFTLPNTTTGIITISGTVQDDSLNTLANAWVWVGNPNTSFFTGSETNSSGIFSITAPKLSSGNNYQVGADKPGYMSTAPLTIAGDANSAGNTLTLPASSLTISGYIYTDTSGDGTYSTSTEAIPNAWVWAEEVNTGQFTNAPADSTGYYELGVINGVWRVNAGANGYQNNVYKVNNTKTNITIAGSSQGSINVALSSNSNWSTKTKSKSITPASGGTVDDSNDDGTGVKLTIPPNALGDDQNAGNVTISDTSSVPESNSTEPLGGIGKEVSAIDNNNSAITGLGEGVFIDVELVYYKADIVAMGIVDYSKLKNLTESYWDNSLNNWSSLSTTRKAYYKTAAADTDWTLMPDSATQTGYEEFIDSLVTGTSYYDYKLVFTAKSDHLTVFGATQPQDSLFPASPTGLSQSSGSGSSVALSWSAVTTNLDTTAITDLLGYQVYRCPASSDCTNNSNYAQKSTTVNAPTVTYTDNSSLSSFTSYYYKVTASDDGGNETALASSTALQICSNKTVSNGTVATNCTITCNSGYNLSGNSCVSSGGAVIPGGGGSSQQQQATTTIETIKEIITETKETIEKVAETTKETAEAFAQKIVDIAVDAAEVIKATVSTLLEKVGAKRSLSAEQAAINKYVRPLVAGMGKVTAEAEHALNNFIVYGTPTTLKLGAGERAGVVNSYKSAFGKLPKTENEWNDAIKIANGRWPSEINKKSEDNAETAFQKIYLRKPDRKNPHDDAAVVVMAYGLRPADRNLESEKTAIQTFKNIYGYTPKTASAWDIVRAIAYSGAKR